ncbi:MAG TPA: squalene--hopene cyclase [Micromonosporaceae bacterium]
MVDTDAAIGFVVARGDALDRARLSFLRTGSSPAEELLAQAEAGQTATGGWPAQWAGDVASVDATCFRLAELDDLVGLHRPAAVRALTWLALRQRGDGFWEEDAALAGVAPPWARPGDPEARFYLTVNAAFWLAVATADTGTPVYHSQLSRAATAIRDCLADNGSWPGFLVAGWLAGAVLHRTEWFYEAARIFAVLRDRVPDMSAADTAWMAAALRRAGLGVDDPLLVAARERLAATQRFDGGWPSDDAPAFDVHTTLTALRALR